MRYIINKQNINKLDTMKLKNKILVPVIGLVTLFFGINNAHGQYSSRGLYGGTINCGTVYDTNIYLGSDDGGVYQNTRQTLNGWKSLSVGLGSGKVRALAHTGSYLFAGTADKGVYIYTGVSGLNRYWNPVNNGLTNQNIKALLALDSITVLAGTNGGGLFQTLDKGANWTNVNNSLFNNSIITGIVKAGSRIILTSQTGGVFASDDNGANWIDLNDVNTLGIAGTNSISYNVSTDELMIANSNGLFLLASASTTTTPAYSSAQGTVATSTNIRSISNTATKWYLATDNGVYSSVTASISWTAANNGSGTMNTRIVVPYQTRLVLGTQLFGIYKTSATTVNWASNNTNFNNIATYSLTTSGNAVVVAATEKGVYVSRNNSNNYTRSNTGLLDSLTLTDVTFLGTNLYASTSTGGVYVSADTGAVWTPFNNGITNLDVKKIVSSTTFIYLFDSNGMVFQSNGTSGWAAVQTGLPNNVHPTSMAFYGTNALLGTLGNGTYKRGEMSGSWIAMNTGLTDLNVTSVTSLGTKLFAGTDGSGVFVYDPTQNNWTAATSISTAFTSMINLDGSKIQAMKTFGSYVFASIKGAVLATPDYGTTWIDACSQFNLPSYSDLNKISFTTRLYVCTQNNSLYYTSLFNLPVNAAVLAIDTISCYNSCSGTAYAIVTGGAGPYTLSWSNGSTADTLTGLCAATYTVTVMDANSNMVVDSIVVA